MHLRLLLKVMDDVIHALSFCNRPRYMYLRPLPHNFHFFRWTLRLAVLIGAGIDSVGWGRRGDIRANNNTKHHNPNHHFHTILQHTTSLMGIHLAGMKLPTLLPNNQPRPFLRFPHRDFRDFRQRLGTNQAIRATAAFFLTLVRVVVCIGYSTWGRDFLNQ